MSRNTGGVGNCPEQQEREEPQYGLKPGPPVRTRRQRYSPDEIYHHRRPANRASRSSPAHNGHPGIALHQGFQRFDRRRIAFQRGTGKLVVCRPRQSRDATGPLHRQRVLQSRRDFPFRGRRHGFRWRMSLIAALSSASSVYIRFSLAFSASSSRRRLRSDTEPTNPGASAISQPWKPWRLARRPHRAERRIPSDCRRPPRPSLPRAWT